MGAILVLGGALGLALWRLLQAPDLDFSMETKLAYVVAGAIVFVLVVANMVRIIRLGGLKDLAKNAVAVHRVGSRWRGIAREEAAAGAAASSLAGDRP